MSKSFRKTSNITLKRIFLVIGAGLAGFGILELLSRILDTPILSHLLRIFRG
jgi:hypothetical protein